MWGSNTPNWKLFYFPQDSIAVWGYYLQFWPVSRGSFQKTLLKRAELAGIHFLYFLFLFCLECRCEARGDAAILESWGSEHRDKSLFLKKADVEKQRELRSVTALWCHSADSGLCPRDSCKKSNELLLTSQLSIPCSWIQILMDTWALVLWGILWKKPS